MEYRVHYRKLAEKYIDAQPKHIKKRIMNAVDKLPEGDVTKLKGRDGYRLTIGGFRVLFDIYDETSDIKIIDVVAIGPRGDVYKK